MINIPVYIGKSKIEGNGVFASKDIKKGSIIVKIGKKERYYSKEAIKKFSKIYKKVLEKFGYWEEDIFVYPVDETKYLNHSCNPNVKNFGNADKSVRNIKKDEELTYDYRIFKNPKPKFKCNCGSINCKKIIGQIK